MTATSPNLRGHWLTEVASHAGLQLVLPPQPDVRDVARAWPQVAEACRLSDAAFTQRLAGYFRVGMADLSSYDPQAVKLIPEAVARRHGVLALSATESNIVVATSDPASRAAARDIASYAGRQPVFLVASPARLAPVLERAYAPARSPRNTLQTLVAQAATSDFRVITNEGTSLFTTFDLEDPALVQLSDYLLQLAVRFRASEFHLEPAGDHGRVRLRIDGVLQHVVDLPVVVHKRLVARLRNLARGRPGVKAEDGFPVTAGNVQLRAHLYTSPSPDGEIVWIRLADPRDVPTLDSLGFDKQGTARIQRVLAKNEGLVLVTGPARSGTSSFVYAALGAFPGRSVLSLEGRPEVVVPGVNQVRFDAGSGASFAETLQKLLDRNPDVLHAGEIRDLATARTVLRSAVTGRKVLASVHTPDAASGIRRLVDMGIAAGRLAESLDAVISIRTVRRLCAHCARPFDPARDGKSREMALAAILDVHPVRLAIGCAECAGTGFAGQIALAEVLETTPEIRRLIEEGRPDAELILAARKAGMRPFDEAGLWKVAEGQTTIEELERVLGFLPMQDKSADAVGSVLVVEDEDDDRQRVAGTLRGMGFPVTEVRRREEAQEALSSDQRFSLVIIDLFLPELVGPELLRSIRRSLPTHALPVIVVTGSDDPRHELEVLDLGADDYILKPVAVDRLESRVRAVLRRAGIQVRGSAGSGSREPVGIGAPN